MAELIYSAIASLDGFVADPEGTFDWAEPDDEVHAFVNDLERGVGTYLYGRRLYEVMVAWETIDDDRAVLRDYAEVWRSSEKVVYSTTLERASSSRTRIERSFDPAAIRAMKASAERDIGIGGPHLAAQAIRAGLVDECHLFLGADRRRWWHAGVPRRRPMGARAAGGAPVRERDDLPPLPGADLIEPRFGDARLRRWAAPRSRCRPPARSPRRRSAAARSRAS